MFLDQLTSLSYWNFILAAIFIIGSVVIARIVIYVLSHLVLHVTSKTKTTLDDVVIAAMKRPIYFGIILVGVYFAINVLNYLGAYLREIKLVFTIIWILLGAYTAKNMIKAFFKWYEGLLSNNGKQIEAFTPRIRKIFTIFIYAIAAILILRAFDIEITPLLAGLGVGGLVIALALQDSLSNLFSGMFMMTDRMIKVGDIIQLDNGPSGVVEEIGWRSTKIRTGQNNVLIVANTKIASDMTVTNFSIPNKELSLLVDVSVPLGSKINDVEAIALDVAKNIQKSVKGAKQDFEPSVRFSAFTDFSIKFTVTLRAESYDDQYLVRHEFIKELKKHFDQAGIDLSVMKK
jgi:small-conductance mechanosensitive channel